MAIDRNDPSTVSIRNTLRQTFRERRRMLSRREQMSAAEAIVEQIKQYNLLANARQIALYMTNDGELDTKALITYLWEQSVQVYLPVLHPFTDGHLLFLEYTPSTPMRANHFGILEPRLDCTKICPLAQLDVLFTPIVAFDDQGNRLGMGGGFYDRTLVSVITKENIQTKVIGLAHDIQKTLTLPTEAWDIPLPYILTPTQLYHCTE